MKKSFSIVSTVFLIFAAALAYATLSGEKNAFRQAADFPRGALLYVQIRDLPALIKLWSESDARRRYAESANFAEFRNRHLALKLAERGEEIYEQVGVAPNLGFASTLSPHSAALAVYDIGKMEFVFVAPMTAEQTAACALYFVKSGFDEIQMDEETLVYAKEIEVDRARQKQKVLFANFRGRLILATTEKYFLQTIETIKGNRGGRRLTDDLAFRQLAARTKPQATTVWLDQQKLNNDWYFKHYWLMSDVKDLKNLRAGMFDFEIGEQKLIEKRVFLTIENKAAGRVSPPDARQFSSLIPARSPFYKIEAVRDFNLNQAVTDVLFGERPETEPDSADKNYYFNDWDKSFSYSYLDEDFSQQINESDGQAAPMPETPAAATDLPQIIGAARPAAVLTLFAPHSPPAPLFFDNRQALAFSLQNAGNLSHAKLETALAAQAKNFFTVGVQKTDLVWVDFPVEGAKARSMAMPSLGWKIFYAIRGEILILANSEELLGEMLAAKSEAVMTNEAFEKYTVINLEARREAFDDVFRALDRDEKDSGDADDNGFFTNNISSLLDVAADVSKIEISQKTNGNFIDEEVIFALRKK